MLKLVESVKLSYDWLILEKTAISILEGTLNSSPIYPITTVKVCTYISKKCHLMLSE